MMVMEKNVGLFVKRPFPSGEDSENRTFQAPLSAERSLMNVLNRKLRWSVRSPAATATKED